MKSRYGQDQPAYCKELSVGVCALVRHLGRQVAAMLVFGTGGPPPMLASLISPLDKIDLSDLPAIETTPARKGGTIAFRHWGVAASAGE